MAGVAFVMSPNINPKVGFDPLRDFVPIALVATIPNVVVVHPSVPAKSLGELVQLARSHPGKLTYASGGVGSGPHLAAEMLKSLTKTQILHVPYKGAALGIVGAMSGEIDIVISVVPSVLPYVNDGRMRALAVLDTKRVGSLPQVPTSAEAGILHQRRRVNSIARIRESGRSLFPCTLARWARGISSRPLRNPTSGYRSRREPYLTFCGSSLVARPKGVAQALRLDSLTG